MQKTGCSEGIIKIFVKNTDELDVLMHRLKKLKEIVEVNRIET